MVATLRRKTGRNRRAIIARCLILLTSVTFADVTLPLRHSVHAQSPTSAAAKPDLHSLVDQLADGEPEKRDRARETLMGISRDDLPELQQVVAKLSDKLIPAQKVALKQIVKQVFLSGVTYETDERPTAFMGVKWDQGDSIMALEAAEPAELATPPIGLMVEMRLPGFDAYRKLHDTDIVIGIDGESTARIHDSSTFSTVLSTYRPGDVVVLVVIRDEDVVRIPVKLAPRPLSTLMSELTNWLDDRDSQAELYWNRNFQTVVGDDTIAMESRDALPASGPMIIVQPGGAIRPGGAIVGPPGSDR